MLESRWEQNPPEGRPARHMYRLTAAGLRYARESVAERPAPARTQLGWQA